MKRDAAQVLREHGIQPSPQRVAVADYILFSELHPSADEVWGAVRVHFSMVSRATVYNTLHLLERKGLVRRLLLAEGKVVFNPHVAPHHHFIDDDSGTIVDVPWSSVEVRHVEALRGFDVREYQVVMRGKRTRRRG